MTHLALRFLGGFEVAIDAEPIAAFGADKVRALLAFLTIESSHPHRRAKLSAMFWPDLPDKKAAHNLSQSLFRLRRALQEEKAPSTPSFLKVTTQHIQFNIHSDCQLDVVRFRELLQLCQQHNHADAASCSVCAQWRAQAAALYQGDLLDSFFVPDSIPFEEWRLMQQEELHQQVLETLNWLAVYHDRRGEHEQVQAYARRQLVLEPWREEAHVQLIRSLSQIGQPTAALKQYKLYEDTLAEELGIKPATAVTKLYEQIRAGEVIQQTTSQSDPKEPIWLSNQGERRQVTTLVCNLSSSGNAEEIQERSTWCEQYCGNIFNRFGGQRAPRRGNSCLVYFGYPQAHEDAARRAVHASLAMVASLDGNESVQIGIHTGMVMVGKKRGTRWQDRDLIGETLEIARDCQRQALPGQVIITEDTRQLIQGAFDLQPLTSPIVSISGQPVSVFQVCGESGVPSRLEWLAQTQRLTVFTGREEELCELQNYYEVMLQGAGQVVFVHGEAGSGKSRLIWELKQRVPVVGKSGNSVTNTVQSTLWLTSRCLPHFEQTSLYPVVGLLEQLLGFQADDSLEMRQEKLAGMLAWYEMKRPFTIWLLSLLLGLPLSKPAPETITKTQREQMRDLFVALLKKRADEQPLVLLVEDIHWSDPSTIEWLGHTVAAVATASCLILLTTRAEVKPAWLSHKEIQSRLHWITLKPLHPEQAAQMIAGLADDNMLDKETRQYIVTHTDGIPFFVEELTKTLLEPAKENTKIKGTAKIPTTLLDSLMTRLDRLGAAKETAQWAAVLGREFSYPVLQACVEWDEQRLQNDLAQLIEAELVIPVNDLVSTMPSSAWYAFKHALIQETAYASLLQRTRQHYHRRTAEVLEARFKHITKTRPEILARHYASANMPVQAADFWLTAGERAAAQGATLEACIFFGRALEGSGPADTERRWQALLGREQVHDTRGERAEQEADLHALLTLAETFDDDTRHFQVYMRQTSFAAMKGDYHAALPLAEAAINAARRANDVTLILRALVYRTQTLLFMGETELSRQGVEEILAYVQDCEDNSLLAFALPIAAQYYMNVGDLAQSVKFQSRSAEAIRQTSSHSVQEASILGNLGLIYAMLGLYAQARTSLEAGKALAKEIGNRRLYATILGHLGYVHGQSGDRVLARQMEEQALKILTESEDAYGKATCSTYLGYLLEEAGELPLAAKYLAQARTGYAVLGLEADKFEAQAVEARVALARGERETAEQLTREIWNHLNEYGSEGFSWPSLVYVCIADVLEAALVPNSSLLYQVIETGYRDLRKRAEKISDTYWRQSFLQNVVENKMIMERWKNDP